MSDKELALVNQPENLPVPVETSYVKAMLEAIKTDFLAQNEGMDLDFVNLGTWLVIDKKGRFVEKDNEQNVNYGDSVDVVIGWGEKRWSLWGKQNSPEDGQLIVSHKDQETAQGMLAQWLAENPEAVERYSMDSLELRYMCIVVPVSTITPNDFPRLHLMSMPPTTTISFGKYAQSIYMGQYKPIVPAKTGVNRVVTRLTTSEKKSKSNASISWVSTDFAAVGMFNPKDYGITE